MTTIMRLLAVALLVVPVFAADIPGFALPTAGRCATSSSRDVRCCAMDVASPSTPRRSGANLGRCNNPCCSGPASSSRTAGRRSTAR